MRKCGKRVSFLLLYGNRQHGGCEKLVFRFMLQTWQQCEIATLIKASSAKAE